MSLECAGSEERFHVSAALLHDIRAVSPECRVSSATRPTVTLVSQGFTSGVGVHSGGRSTAGSTFSLGCASGAGLQLMMPSAPGAQSYRSEERRVGKEG